MRVAKALIGVAILTLVAGCASAPPSQQAVAASGTRTATASRVVPCTTTGLGVATTANCGGGFSLFSAAGE